MKKVLLALLLVLSLSTGGCVLQSTHNKALDDNRELLISLDNRYKQIDIMATNRELEFEEKKQKAPGWLKLLIATLPSWEAEIRRYQKKLGNKEQK